MAADRAAITALACSQPSDHREVSKCWTVDQIAEASIKERFVERISGSSVRRLLREGKIMPWRCHSWQKSTDPDYIEKAAPVLDLYQIAPPPLNKAP